MPTIAAIATAPGAGGIGIVRISGPQSREILSRMFSPTSAKFSGFRPWVLHRGRALDHEGAPLDDVLAVFMPGPRTFTGEDVAEIHCHGGPFIVQAILETALRLGARAAERGEFSRRAFANGRMDLSQAEAVAELIAAPSREALRYSLNRLDGLLGRKVTALRRRLEELRVQMSLAVDFPDEEVECLAPEAFAAVVEDVAAAVRGLLTGQRRAQVMQQGAVVVLAGAVNAGKSSLLNALLGRNRALVTDIPGTTRDAVEQTVTLGRHLLRLLDTAGIRETADRVEELGVARALQAAQTCQLALFVVDGSKPLTPEDEAAMDAALQAPEAIAILNKQDLPCVMDPSELPFAYVIPVSCAKNEGLDLLEQALDMVFDFDAPCDGSILTNARQADAIAKSRESIEAALSSLRLGMTPDAVLVDVEAAMESLGEATGRVVREDITNRIFERFCVGK